MNAISISLVAMILVASLAAVAPVAQFTQHEFAALSAHTTSARAKVRIGAGSGLTV